ncbi:MAG: Formamidopyrimidine-DNA glycosidase [Rickettsiaceae bacterium]|jgi:formamidopyrimidine-DNA glycosylase|nr:Formamidopyrimidine-DNA glycosidase [Rickettsiaceae bacterium]
MPELPEVETVRRSLEPFIIDKTIIGVETFRDNLRYPFPNNLEELCINNKIISVERRAKYLILKLENNYNIIVHLGMSGRFTLSPMREIVKHDHIIFTLEDNNILTLNDPRRFGLIDLIPQNEMASHKYFANLGPEPLTDDFNASYFLKAALRKSSPIKNFIMDSKIVVGVGNIYASESLHIASIHPERPANSLSAKEVERLVQAIKDVLNKAIIAGGSTLKDFVSGQGDAGYFQHNFLVYGKHGKTCAICNNIIEKMIQAGRASFFCKRCQK